MSDGKALGGLKEEAVATLAAIGPGPLSRPETDRDG